MKKILIIGASSGIGRKLALDLAEKGHQVFGTYFQHPTHDSNISFHPLDVMEDALDFSFLPSDLDGLVYCPGSIDLKPFHRIDPNDFVQDFKLQVEGAVKVVQALLPRLKNSENPSLVFFSTVAVQKGFTFHAKVSSSKGAIEGLSRALAAELAPKIRVNTIAPSLTDTPLSKNLLNTEEKMKANAERHPLKRIGAASDISEMAQFLLSDQSSWMTGQILHIDGGMSSINR